MGEPLNTARTVGNEKYGDLETAVFVLPWSDRVFRRAGTETYWGDSYVDGPQIRELSVPLSEKFRLLFTGEKRPVDGQVFGWDSTAEVGIQWEVGKGIWLGPEAGLRTFTDMDGGSKNEFFVGVGLRF